MSYDECKTLVKVIKCESKNVTFDKNCEKNVSGIILN